MPLVFSKLPGYAIEGESITLDQTSNDIDEKVGSGGGPKILSLTYPNGKTNTESSATETLILTGNNFNVNANVWVGNNLSNNTVVSNSNYLTFVCPVLDVGNYTVYVVNTDGGVGFLNPGVQVVPYTFQGIVSGYSTGGVAPSSPLPTVVNTIDKFSFASDANATDVGDLTQVRNELSGQSSSSSGYSSGGGFPGKNTIDKFPFATDANAIDVGDLTQARSVTAGQSSADNGYASGGFGTPSFLNTIDKFPFATDANATDVGDLTLARNLPSGQSSDVSGYTSGGYNTPSLRDIIDKFPFATNANATDVGDLTQARDGLAGQSSESHGYSTGGVSISFNPPINTIDKFPFATNANATDVGDLTQARTKATGQSSIASGYSSGGDTLLSPETFYSTIDKFPFASDANATDVGDLTQARSRAAGQQV